MKCIPDIIIQYLTTLCESGRHQWDPLIGNLISVDNFRRHFVRRDYRLMLFLQYKRFIGLMLFFTIPTNKTTIEQSLHKISSTTMFIIPLYIIDSFKYCFKAINNQMSSVYVAVPVLVTFIVVGTVTDIARITVHSLDNNVFVAIVLARAR